MRWEAANPAGPRGLSVQLLCLDAQAHYHSSGKAVANLCPRATFARKSLSTREPLPPPNGPPRRLSGTQGSPRDLSAKKDDPPVTQVTAECPPSTDATAVHLDGDLAEKSRRSYGILSLEQLLEAGMTAARVKGACRRGSLERVLPRVYRVTSVPESWEQRPMAGTRWGRPITVASGPTAAFLHELLPRRVEKVHLTSDHALHARPGFSVRQCCLLPQDLTVVRGIPCTSVRE